MNILSIDSGNYSVKFLEFITDGRHLKLQNYNEVVLHEAAKNYSETLSRKELQYQIIKKFLSESNFNGKIISLIPSQLVTYRFFDLPITSKKKAEMMIPHQLDDNIPYSVSKIHYVSDLQREDNVTHALVNIAQLENFEPYYNTLVKDKILPTHIYSELSVMNNYTLEFCNTVPTCILDIGHKTTKAYFVVKGRVIATHTSYFGGENVTEMISEAYQISKDKAEEYKHTQSFFLTTAQYPEANDAQREFAEIMKQTLLPLIADFKRWELGFKVQYAVPIEQILITGGTSNIENIGNFLSENLNIKVSKFDPLSYGKHSHNLTDAETSSLGIAEIMAISQITKKAPSNFLKGQFNSGYSDTIPMHSTFFIGARVLIVAVILCLAFALDLFTLSMQNKNLDRAIVKQVKLPIYELTPKEIRNVKKQGHRLLKKLQRQEKQIVSGIAALENSSNQSAINSLVNLSKTVGANTKIEMISFNFNSGIAIATFKSKVVSELQDVEKRLKRSSLNGLETTLDQAKIELTVEFRE